MSRFFVNVVAVVTAMFGDGAVDTSGNLMHHKVTFGDGAHARTQRIYPSSIPSATVQAELGSTYLPSYLAIYKYIAM